MDRSLFGYAVVYKQHDTFDNCECSESVIFVINLRQPAMRETIITEVSHKITL